jgi:chromosome segregation ATPase
MASLDELEARAQAAARALTNRQEHKQSLQSTLHQLEGVVAEEREQRVRLEAEIGAALDERKRVEVESKQLREENQRLDSGDKQAREAVERLEGEVATLREERDRTVAILEALVTQIELNVNTSAEAVEAVPVEAVARSAAQADGTTGMAIVQDDAPPESAEVITALSDEEAQAEAVDLRDDKVKGLMDRIRNRTG